VPQASGRKDSSFCEQKEAKKLCPLGWHVPSDAEWTTLENYLTANKYNYDSTTTGIKFAKSLAYTSGWDASSTIGSVGNDQTSNNKTGFSGLAAGACWADGVFQFFGVAGFWWSSTEQSTDDAYSCDIINTGSYTDRGGSYKRNGFSVRCIKN
jgi:uncharacterized protein (TIGR02145 family)